MLAAVFKEKSKPLVLEEHAMPVPHDYQVRVKVKACGICGSDLHAAEADWTPQNVVMGHEFSGVIDAVGSKVTKWKLGDHVVPLAQISCGECTFCQAAKPSECINLITIDYNPEFNGAYAEYCLVGEGDCLPMPSTISFAEAAAVEPLAVGLDAIRRANVGIDDSILIIGAGPIGLTIAQWAKFVGARDVVVSELNPVRLAKATEMGATATIDASKETDPVASFQAMTGRKPNIIVEAVGIPGMIQKCVEMAQPNSRVIVVGVCQKTDTFEPLQCILKSLQLVFCYGYTTDDYAYILDMLESKRISALPLISGEISLSELPTVFEKMKTPKGEIKVIVAP